MLPRKQTTGNRRTIPEKSLEPEVRVARRSLIDNGWSYRSAAKAVGCHHMHLTQVLTGRRVSHDLCQRLSLLPQRATEGGQA